MKADTMFGQFDIWLNLIVWLTQLRHYSLVEKSLYILSVDQVPLDKWFTTQST